MENTGKTSKVLECVLRFVLCILKWVLIVVVVSTLCTTAFTFAMDYAVINILVTDGLKMRVGVALQEKNSEELTKFFTEDYILVDPLQYDTTYYDYTINSYDAQVEVHSLYTRPWKEEATATVTCSATIDGELPISLQTPEQLANPNKIRPPEWETKSYEMKLEKTDGNWIITEVTETEPPAEE